MKYQLAGADKYYIASSIEMGKEEIFLDAGLFGSSDTGTLTLETKGFINFLRRTPQQKPVPILNT